MPSWRIDGRGLLRSSAPAITSGEVRDEKLERLCGLRADRFVGKRSPTPGHFLLLFRIWARLLGVPAVRLRLEDHGEARMIREWLERRHLGLRTSLHQAASVLLVQRRTDPLAGSRFSTLRRMDRKAAKLGITCREVALSEREALLDKAIAFERAHPDPRYRRKRPNTEGLSSVHLWLVAENKAGEPLALSVTPISGSAALLRYMRTLASGQEATLARYALTAELLRVLAKRRVRYLVDNVSPISVPSSLRHFATMVGFRILRARLRG